MNSFRRPDSGHCTNRARRFGGLLATCLLLWTGWAAAAEPEQTAPPLVPIPLSDIPARASAERSTHDQAEVLLKRAAVFEEIESRLLARERTITRELVSLGPTLAAASSREAIGEIERKWLETDRALEESENELQRRTGIIQQQMSRLDVTLRVWQLTVQEAKDTAAPEEVLNLARTTTDDIARVSKSLRHTLDRALALQAKVGRARGTVQESLERIRAEETSLLNNLVRRERPPLWSEAIAGTSHADLVANTGAELRKWTGSILEVVRTQYDRLGFQVFVLLVLTLILYRSSHAARAWTETDPVIARGTSVFERPFALAAVIVLILTPWFYVYTPPALTDAVGLLLVLPVLSLILPLLDVSVRPALFLLALLYVLDQVRDLLEAAPLVARLIFILEMILAIGIIAWLMRSKFWRAGGDSGKAKGWVSLFGYALSAALFLLIVAALAAVSGYVRLAVLLGSGVLNSIYLALLLAALERTAEAIIRLGLHSRAAQGLNYLRTRTDKLRWRLAKILRIAVVLVWALLTLDFFALRDYFSAAVGRVFLSDFQAGALAFSLADVLAFVATIIAAVLLARFIVRVLDEDVYPRVALGRGVSFAISAVIKYGIILAGFLIAVGAMGFGMDRITILLGAFGVGLGFGLQTIVNNFISGMILIFERPVQIGDSVEIGSVKGRITRIGIRSSTVRSFEGADITLPNGTLLSDALINWTMTDRNRRLEIPVGVAYGTDPDQVIEALREGLAGQEGLLEDPAPQIVFNGFGDSSLDFVLRAWVADNDNFVSIRSNLALAMNRVLNARGIEIPFPQRDLHLRSVAPEVQLPGKS